MHIPLHIFKYITRQWTYRLQMLVGFVPKIQISADSVILIVFSPLNPSFECLNKFKLLHTFRFNAIIKNAL